jgi:hypothetical protein
MIVVYSMSGIVAMLIMGLWIGNDKDDDSMYY